MGGESRSMMWALCLLLTLRGVLATNDAKPNFGLFCPPDLFYPSEGKLCIHTQAALRDYSVLTINLKTKSTRKALYMVTARSPNWACPSFEVPQPSKETEECHIEVEGMKADGEKVILASKLLTVRKNKEGSFIETDKAVYTSGQYVLFRAVTINKDLEVQNKSFSLIELQDPQGNRLAQWRDVFPVNGIVERSYHISAEPMLGVYTLKADTTKKMFEVRDYVPPRFELLIEAPDKVSVQDDHFTALMHGRYTYGEVVPGTVTLKVCQKRRPRWRWWWGSSSSEEQTKLKDPCYTEVGKTDRKGRLLSVVNLGDFNLKSSLYSAELTVEATLEEEGTGVKLGTTKTINIESQLTKLSFKDTKSYYQPGAPYRGKLSLTTYDGQPLGSKNINLKMRYQGKEKTENFTTDRKGEVTFQLPTEKWGKGSVSIQASTDDPDEPYRSGKVAVRYGRASLYVSDIHVETTRSLYIRPVQSSAPCHHNVPVTVDYTLIEEDEGTVEFFYMVMVDDRISHHGKTKVEGINAGSLSGSLNISLPIREASPAGKLLCFVVSASGKVAVDTTTLRVTPCLKHAVSMKFSEDKVLPRSKVNMLLQAAAGSTCALRVVDNSVVLMKPEAELTLSKLQNLVPVQRTKIYNKPDREHCNKQNPPPFLSSDQSGYSSSSSSYDSWWRRDYYAEKKKDVINIVEQEMGLYLMSSWMAVAPVICHRQRALMLKKSRPRVALAQPAMSHELEFAEASLESSEEASDMKDDGGDAPRFLFLETLVWQQQQIPSSGLAEVPVTMPDTITQWSGQMFCVGPHSLGLSSPTYLTTFKPFFVHLNAPSSMVKEETVTLTATVSNYQNQPMMIRSSLPASDQFIQKGASTVTFCLAGGQTKTLSWKVTPVDLGPMNISVTAEAVKSQEICDGQKTVVPARGSKDAVLRTLLVKPGGTMVEQTHNSMITVEGNSVSEKVTLEFPPSVIAGSEKAFITTTGDLMGAAMNNVENLLKMSYGCGEQNMAQFAPNVIVLQYLKASGQQTPALQEKAKRLMESGRDRQLNYKHRDGSYSAFGQSDKEGSTWLTAFVCKTLHQSKDFTHIDEEQLQRSLTWLKNQQRSDGCFQARGRLLNNALRGGVDDVVSLSTYILIALLESGESWSDPVVQKALQCIRKEPLEEASLYKLVLKAYALSLANCTEDHSRAMQLLYAKANRRDGMLFWSQEERADKASYWSKPKSVDVEINAYAMLSMSKIARASQRDLSNMVDCARWLRTQQNANGGFSSTQDTVMGLQALACFASMVFSKSGEVEVKVTSDRGFLHRLKVNADNRLLLQRVILPNVSDQYVINVSGTGTAYIQVTQRHHAPPTTQEPAFILQAKCLCLPNNQMTISLSFRYKGSRQSSNMVVVKVEMLSGYSPQKESIEEVKKLPGVKRVEDKDGEMSIYMEEVTSEQRTMDIRTERCMLVSRLKAATACIFDYYLPEEENKVSYVSECP